MTDAKAARYSWEIEVEDAGERLDKFLANQLGDVSRSKVQQWIKDGRVTVNERPVKASYRLGVDDVVQVEVPEAVPLQVVPEPLPLSIVYEDADLLVIDKPRGMVVHPAPGHETGTLVNGLLYHCRDLSGINGVLRPGIVHRIDKDTSGLLMVAKHDAAHVHLAKQLAEHTVEREYVAIVHGKVSADRGTIDAPIGRDPTDRQRMAVVEKGGKRAVTHFVVEQRFANYTLLRLRLETGRTHQIRVHMKYIGHPVAGDPKYGPRRTLPIAGQALHAAVLGFVHPRTHQWMRFEAPLPEDMRTLLRRLTAERS
ncbi:MAG: pseudouridine synthase [Bacillaceae bacterium G1]|nr:RluA family pseudouridine synthase [Bacillota bacterium]OJF17460.1 MAG: pseudouridine synthase [Bacillaceae bacterium G1]